ncbi:MAG: transposase [candidate division NC10 bacterium]|nr:transposase [candidate division NC10 bacterium]
MTKTLYVGIDVASRSNTAQGVDPTGQALGKPWPFPNTLPGAQALEARLATMLQQGAYDHVMIGLEATAFYDWHLADYLAASGLSPECPLRLALPESRR